VFWLKDSGERAARLPGASPALSSQPYIKRAGAAVGAAGFFEAQHDAAQVGCAQPMRREAPQHARLVDP